ncbi:hypothetical protein A1I_06690 [Rickettsia bellii OSU 85-389]|uniref:hypothetical protein n=1 Tax=Rickettsia bellii TaxID=33990 RepID=UPI0000DB1048|nr:hypothetical protein [Rickettsia bellii]ABV79654.1 hypothetical protein A1I_06690 [Rickettsia bellii OSU 85-389]
MEFNRKNAIISFLEERAEQKFTPYDIAKWLVANYPEEAERKATTSKNKQIIKARTLEEKIKEVTKAYAAEISRGRFDEWRSKPNIKIDSEPRVSLYYTKNPSHLINDEEVTNLKNKVNKDNSITEEKAYEILKSYLDVLGIHNMRINHTFSSNKHGVGGNIWLHPDWVGMEVLNKNWSPLIKDCAKYYTGKQARLWSFEVKREINRSNVRESFFQALSNSSWAHYGYLVAPILDETKADTKNELEMLCTRHGIGFILLNVDFPEDSKKLIPARERSEIDWNMANRLAEENKNFENLFK